MDALSPGKSLVDKAYDAILNAICAGEFRPGKRLNQDEIAAQLNISRQPVNSAIAMLKSQRFLQDTGKRGVVVSPVDTNLFTSIYQFRLAVDPLATRLATPRFTEETMATGRHIIEHGKSSVRNDDRSAALRADMEFHELIYQLSGNIIICDVMQLNWKHLQRSMGEVLRTPGMSLRVWNEHSNIFNAILEGNADCAAALMREHLSQAIERTPQFIVSD